MLGMGNRNRSDGHDEQTRSGSLNLGKRQAVRFGLPVSFGLLAALLAAVVFVAIASAAPITALDDAGADDEPGQKDLSYLVLDYAPGGANDIVVKWGWDDTAWSGNNTGDACTLFDTDGDGFANYSLCITVDEAGAYEATRLYTCVADSKSDRCGGPALVPSVAVASTGTASVQETDPFGTSGRSDNDCSDGGVTGCLIDDTVAELGVELSDFGGANAKLINVCSYPSQEPNSDPSDCIFTPNNGFLTIRKVDTKSGDTTTFNFTTNPAAQDGTAAFSVNGSGDAATIKSYRPTTSLTVIPRRDRSRCLPARSSRAVPTFRTS